MENLRIKSNPFQKTFDIEKDNFGTYIPCGEDIGTVYSYAINPKCARKDMGII